MKTILVVDDEIGILESFRMILKDTYRVLTANDGLKALEILRNESVNLVILDIIMPGMAGLDVLKEINKTYHDIDTIIVTAIKTVKTAIDSMKLGASDYIVKPFDVEEIKLIIDKILHSRELSQEVAYLRSEINKDFEFNNIIGQCPTMRQIVDTVMRVAKGNSPALIRGESGTGKELIARAIHVQSSRNAKPFIAVSCPNLHDNLLESELFGHEKGAFTNATDKKTGRFELANGGTIFLDEISEMSLANQAKLLRVSQEYEFVRVGGTKTISIDVRLIAATNVDLKTAIAKGTFREDLFYRINVVPIDLPPLRERKEDIPLLINHYFQKYKKEFHSKAKRIHPSAMKLLENYLWPGNIRELKNVIERVLTLYGDSDAILGEHLPLEIRKEFDYTTSHNITNPVELSGIESLDEIVSRIEKEIIEKALQKANGRQTRAAQFLKTTRRILKYKMSKLGITT
ncbi:two-component response regulator [Candidatus Jettenia caeni]|uniref:Two-component response regulator n=1 Tax=Candidatus Jettenia caeni TaxID=247490 RepID=I3IKC2_9BACT|nr:two-component response regulator [Candidatus Jettenia caeni]